MAYGCASGTTTVSDPSCSAQLKWAGGDEGSPLMNPGKDCIACHTSRGEGPKLAIAGTVFGKNDDADTCVGKSGISVEITDANGKVATLTTNESGNFTLGGSLAMPYTARVYYGGKERKMFSPQSTGACNACHTAKGANGAPGRVLIPQ